MELIRLEFQSFRDFAETAWPGLGRDGLWVPPGAPLPEDLDEVRLEVGLAEGSPLLRGVVRVETEEESGRAFLRFLELDRPSRVLLERIEAKLGRPLTVGPPPREDAVQGPEGRRSGHEPADGERSQTVAEGIPIRPAPFPEEGAHAAGPSTPAEAHTLEELAGLLAREDRQAALAQTQRIPGPARRPSPVQPALPVLSPPPAAAEPAPLPPYLGGEDPESSRRRIVVVRSPWLWIVVVVGLLAGAWGLGRGLRQDARGASAEGAAAARPDLPAASPARTAAAPFDRVERIEWEIGESSTVVTVWVDGSIPRERWSTERIDGGPAREVLTLRGVDTVPESESFEIGGPHVQRVRAGVHRGSDGASLQVVADLAASQVRLAGVDVRERALQLVFVTD